MISERMLKNWRRDALFVKDGRIIGPMEEGDNYMTKLETDNKTLADRIIKLTQELMDYHLIRKQGG